MQAAVTLVARVRAVAMLLAVRPCACLPRTRMQAHELRRTRAHGQAHPACSAGLPCTHTRACSHVCASMCVHAQARTRVCSYIWLHTCRCIVFGVVCVSLFVCMFACVRAFTYLTKVCSTSVRARARVISDCACFCASLRVKVCVLS